MIVFLKRKRNKIMGVKTYKDVASMQKNPSATGSTGATIGKPVKVSGGRIKVAKGGRVKKAGGGRVKRRGGGSGPGKVGPRNLNVPAYTGRPRPRRTSDEMDPRTPGTPRGEPGNGRGNGDTAPGTSRTVPDAPPSRPGGRTGGRVSKAKGGKAKR